MNFVKLGKHFKKKKKWLGVHRNTLISKTGVILIEAEKIIKRWKEYLKKLYEDNSNIVFEEDDNVNESNKLDYILRAEFNDAIEYWKNNKDLE